MTLATMFLACNGSTVNPSSTPDASTDAPVSSTPPSCGASAVGAGSTCGVSQNDDCCSSPAVPPGSFDRDFDVTEQTGSGLHATLSGFFLDKYEVTVGRYRAFLDAYPSSKPTAGAGSHPNIPSSGWNPSWPLAADASGLMANYSSTNCNGLAFTVAPGANETKPMTCLTWFEAFAFCAWDGGRLPTSAELNYAESGGAEARYYPWSSPPSNMQVDASFAIFTPDSSTNPLMGPADVGGLLSGAGKWGQLDLAGNAAEWVLDVPGNKPSECSDCAQVPSATDATRETRGGAWFSGFTDPSVFVSEVDLRNARPNVQTASEAWGYLGVRCARDQ
jgi:sulfatase modifying factor 1